MNQNPINEECNNELATEAVEDGAVSIAENCDEPKSQPAIDPDNPNSDESKKNMRMIIKQAREMVSILENQWLSSRDEFKLTDSQMKSLYKYNEEHRTEMPNNLNEEEQQNWDHFNGLNDITEEAVIDIFGEDHPIIGITHQITQGRIKDVVSDFFSYTLALREYNNVNDAYLAFVEEQEENEMNKLKIIAENEQDPKKKAILQNSLDTYYNRKYLGFLAEPMEENQLNAIASAFTDHKKIEYWLSRTQDKLDQLKISTKFILEISQFEKRFLPEKYHRLNNILLLYFMDLVVFSNMGDKKDHGRNRALCMVFALDKVVRDKLPENQRSMVLNHITQMLDQFIDKIPEKKEEE